MKSSIYVLMRSWNASQFFDRSIESIHRQTYKDYTILFIDDASDYTKAQIQHIRDVLHGHVTVFNKERKYSTRNAFEMIHTYVKDDDAVIINVDGDDWLEGDDVFGTILKEYEKTSCLLTYGNCYYFAPTSSLHGVVASVYRDINCRYTVNIERHNEYRDTYFLPFHMRTWKSGLFKKIRQQSFLRPDGSWIRFCEDQAMFLPMLEMANGRYSVMSRPLYWYNALTPWSDEKLYKSVRLYDEVWIHRQKPYAPII